MSKSQRDKGARFEREAAKIFEEAMPGAGWRRNPQSQGGRIAGADIVARGCPLLHVECKVGALPNPRAALAQAERDSKDGQYPCAVVKDDRCEPFVVMRLDDWLEIISQWWRETK